MMVWETYFFGENIVIDEKEAKVFQKYSVVRKC